MTEETSRGHIIDTEHLPKQFPTHRHVETFWAHLGRAVATFGFLEEVLAKAIFALTATRPYNESEIDEAFEQWLPKLERALTDPLGGLIDSFGKAVRDYPDEAITNLPDLLSDLKKAASMRNILCHGSWRLPDSQEGAMRGNGVRIARLQDDDMIYPWHENPVFIILEHVITSSSEETPVKMSSSAMETDTGSIFSSRRG